MLKALAREYKERGVEFVSLSCDSQEIRWRNEMGFMGAEGHQWWIAGNNAFMTAFEIYTIPRLILIDPKGRIGCNTGKDRGTLSCQLHSSPSSMPLEARAR